MSFESLLAIATTATGIARCEVIGSAVLLLGDSASVVKPARASGAALVTDPPYGIGYVVNARTWQSAGLDSTKPWAMERRGPIVGDGHPFDVSCLLGFGKAAIFGANHMNGLPAGGRWIVWDKRRESKPDCHSDCELIWTNVKGADRIHRQKWRGVVREGEENASRSRKLHPNQKPVALLRRVFEEIGIAGGDTVFDPFMGSGSTGVVALRAGNAFLGVFGGAAHFDTACRRLEREVTAIPSSDGAA